MFVNEFGKTAAQELNQQLSKVYRWQLDLERINESDASNMLQTLHNKISAIRSTSQAHHAERNPEFMEAVMVSRVLESWRAELESSSRMNLVERKMDSKAKAKREKYVKGMKKVKGDFKKRYGNRADDVMYATATKMAQESTTHRAMGILRIALTEGEIETARVTMAARDMVDTIQDLVEKIGKMQNEQLPALVSAMKDEIGIDQANQFNSTAMAAMATIMDAANGARDTLDNASRGVYSAQPMDMSAAPAAAAPAPAGGLEGGNVTDTGAAPAAQPEELATADSATGGSEQLGRGKRV
jgi:uncharacterized protein involved in tolerance to divalent cations